VLPLVDRRGSPGQCVGVDLGKGKGESQQEKCVGEEYVGVPVGGPLADGELAETDDCREVGGVGWVRVREAPESAKWSSAWL